MTTELTLATNETLAAAQPEIPQKSPETIAEEAGSVILDQISDQALEPQPDGTYVSDQEGIKVIWTDADFSRDSSGPLVAAE